MYMSKVFIPTMREVPAEAEITSHKLLLRAGMMRKTVSGVYTYLPLGYKVIRKIQDIVREEMARAGSQELLMPALLPIEPYEATGRVEVYGPLMFKLKDRNERNFCLGPTHEEIFAETVKAEVKSYRQLPFNLYQIQTKYRDEKRPRFGLFRCREFIMKDAYSFDKDYEGLDVSYKSMHDAYKKVFDRLGLDYIAVYADSGEIGGTGSQEFMAKIDIGEDKIAFCDKCGYAANIEKAECVTQETGSDEKELQMEKVNTPGTKTIEEVVQFLNVDVKKTVKTLIYRADKDFVAVLVRGDREVNETKLRNLLGCIELEMAEPEKVKEVTGAETGFAGPVELKIDIIADNEVAKMKNTIVGANQVDYHIINANTGRDYKVSKVADIRNIQAGEPCPKCGAPIDMTNGTEVGHIFKLGTKYSEPLDCTYIDENGKSKPIVMGSYGIGVSRCMAVIIEQNNDENGIIWPVSVAPYHIIIVPVNTKDEIQMKVAEDIYKNLIGRGIDVILDDRDERPGVKFKDADLIGIPVRITVGKKTGEGIVEFKERKSTEIEEVSVENALSKAVNIVREGLKY